MAQDQADIQSKLVVGRMRACVQRGTPYINVTQVTLPSWQPATADTTECLRPLEDSQHFTAYQAAMEIYRLVNKASVEIHLEMDFVRMQPRLAGFKLIAGHHGGPRRMVLVQHKLDARERSCLTPFSKVAIGRGSVGKRRYYFQAGDRFDFLFYQFDHPKGPYGLLITTIFFLPERMIPHDFYETEELEADFTRTEFEQYRFDMDAGGDWIRHMWQIIVQEPRPRGTSTRPLRPAAEHGGGESSTLLPPPIANPSKGKDILTRRDYANFMRPRHRQIFDVLMKQCAQRKSGLVVLWATNHPMGDFGFCRWQWKDEQQQTFFRTSVPPFFIHRLPPDTPTVPFYLFSRSLECN